MLPIAALVAVAVAVWALWRDVDPDAKPHDTSREWDRAAVGANQVDQLLQRAARPLSNVPSIYERSMSPQYRWIQAKLLASGGVYAGSVEVFLAVQVAALVAAVVVASLVLLLSPDALGTIVGLLFGASIAAYPYTQVNKRAKERTAEIGETLPVFADLLQMPLSAGMGVLPAISFTVERMRPGVVRDELANMLALQKSRAVTDEEAFIYAAERLGTPEAKAFFTSLMQAHTQGMRVAENIDKQAEALRAKAFETRLAKIEKLPTKISTVVALGFMPLLLVVALLPIGGSLSNF